MAKKAPFWLKPHLFVQLYAGSGSPYAVRVNSKKLLGMILTLFFIFCSCIIGSLCFFRELELNRKLNERVLAFEAQQNMTPYLEQLTKLRQVATSPQEPNTTDVKTKELPQSLKTEDVAEKKETPNEKWEAYSNSNPALAINTKARVTDAITECLEEKCTFKVAMVPTEPGLAQGEILIVLEAEIPRIGTMTPTSNIRKRYFVYPTAQAYDELNQEKLLQLPRKNYRFSRSLNTTGEFNIGKLLRPLALNIYLFDKTGSIVHHERKVIESGE